MRPVVLLSLLALSLPAVAKKPAPAPTQVTFAFGWKPGWKATVTTVTAKTRDGVEAPAFTSTASLDVVAAPDGDLRLDWHDGTTAFADPGVATLFEGLDPSDPDELVHADGTWAGFADPASIDANLRTLLARLDTLAPQAPSVVPGGDQAVAGVKQLMATMLSPQVLAGKATQTWGDAVAYWIDATLDVGDPYVSETEETNPLGQRVRQHTDLVVQGFEPCHAGKRAPTCVRVHRRLVPDPVSTLALMRDLMASILAPLGGPEALTEVSIADEVDVLVEPATLRPWRVERARTATLAITDPSSPTPTQTTVDRTTKTWTWR